MTETRRMTEVAILVAMAIVLELALSFLPAMPQGGRISISMLPLFVITWRHGIKYGVIGGVVYGILNLMLDGKLYHWGSFFLDYTIAFGLLGFTAIFKSIIGDNVYGFGVAIVVGFILRFFSHFLSGVILFGEYAEGNVYIYSATYNLTYLLPAMIVTLIVGVAVFFPLKSLERDAD